MTEPTTHAHRARAYALLALGFDRPDDDLEAGLEDGVFEREVRTAGDALDLREEAEAVVDASPTDPEGIDSLYAAYANAFGFEHGGQVSQYEVSYSPRTLLTSTNDLADIAGFYGAFDLAVADGGRERVDHLAIELEYVSHVANQTAYLLETGDERGVEVVTDAQRSFLEDHLGRWISRFGDAVRETVEEPFYVALTDFLCALVAADVDRFDADPDVFPADAPEPLEAFTPAEEDGDFRCGGCGLASDGPRDSILREGPK